MAMDSRDAVGAPLRPVVRIRAAAEVFAQLASALLAPDWPIGSALPSEASLAERFGVSRIIVRQAIHKLAEMGMVRARQGGATIVLDPWQSSDVRVIELLYARAGLTPHEARDLFERQLFQGYALVQLASRRAPKRALDAVQVMLEKFEPNASGPAQWAALEERFWRALAQAGGNRLYEFDMNWWFRFTAEHPKLRALNPTPIAMRVAFLRELTRRMREGQRAPAFYLEAVEPLLGTGAVKRRG
jgi:DNA-binding FadR family transcriptional regulator